MLKAILAKNSTYVPGNVAMGLCLFLLKKSEDARKYLGKVLLLEY